MVQIYDPGTAPNGSPTFDQILAKLQSCVAVAPSFRQKLVHVPLNMDRPYWADDPDFDLEFHVRHIALPKPGGWRQFCVQVARLHARPLDLSRPPWEMTVIDGLDDIPGLPMGCFATVLKVHHSAIDGVSGVELLNVIHDFRPDAPPVGPAADWHPEPLPSPAELLRRAGSHAISNPIQSARVLITNASPLGRQLVSGLRRNGDSLRIPRTRFNQRVSAHRVFDDARCSLADLKVIKSAVPGSTINDVCLSIIGGALRAYLGATDELPAEPLVTMVPVSTRTPDQAGEGGNQVSMMRVSMHTDVDDPLERLRAIRDETAYKKASQNGVAVPVLLEVARLVPGALIGAAMRGMGAFGDRGPIMANTIVTNVPGSQVPLYFLGAQLVRSTGCVPLTDGIGLFHCVSSFCGEFTFMVTADRDLMPDPAPYVEWLLASVAEHLAAARQADDSLSGAAPDRIRASAGGAKSVSAPATTKPRKRAVAKASS